ncbi:MAG: hypothetical protein JWM74_4257 [Myxococcaceae bacterium]|nr:hypothetical protein [Myxococcaceae bacterium]
MGKRAGSSMNGADRKNPNIQAAVIRNDIQSTRADMSRTVNEIEERLSPSHLKEQVLEQFHDAKDTVLEELRDAKENVKEDLVREFAQAKGAVREEIQDAKAAVREATLGKVEHMAQDVRHMAHDARETVTDAGSSIVDTIKANPIPAALIAVGVGWLLMGRRSSTPTRRLGRRNMGALHMGYEGEFEEYDYGRTPNVAGRVQNLAHRVQDGAGHLVDETRGLARNVGDRVGRVAQDATGTVGRVAHDASETVGRVAHDASETVGRVAHDARDMAVHFADDAQMTAGRAYRGARTGVIRAEQGFESQLQENPLAVGAVALAIGAAIGLALPHTRQEDEWMGKTKERLFERAEGVAHEAISKVEEVAGDLTEKIGTQGKDGGSAGKNGGTQSRSMS